jgi:5'-methylthioadenosine phosphorylase
MSNLKIGLIGGSGLGATLASQTEGHRHEIETPFGKTSDAIIETSWNNLPIFLLNRHGPGHLLNPSQVPYRANIFALKKLGCTHIIASTAVGSLREEFKPKDLLVPDQIIDKTSKRAATFFDNAAVHVEFAEPFCPVLRQILIEAGSNEFATHNRGCYVAMEGPAFSTRAESLMHRLWGGDLIGMTAMPEAKLAREAEIAYAIVALVTDYDCWRPKPAGENPQSLLNEIIGNLQAATNNAAILIRRTIEIMASKSPQQLVSLAHDALRLGIWSDKSKISPEQVQRLSPLWIKYFGS